MMKIIRSVWHFAWALFSALYYAFPSWRIKVIGITGTKGKSTTLELLSAMLEAEGFKTALLSSVYVKVGEKRQRNLTGNSMPGRGFAQRFLYEAVSAGCDFALLEVTSEGTIQHRHRFIAFDAGGITNLKPEHIEAHGSFEAYRDAKLAFFRAVVSSCKKEKKLFVRQDDDAVAPFAALKPEITTLFSLEDIVAPPTVWGEINAENIALAAAVARAFGVSQASITKALLEFKGLPGRLEFIQENPFAVVIDYAHTPDSLEKLLSALGRCYQALICVLGAAGGGRDKWKRPVLGEVASRFCRYVILTDEDPYDEDPRAIVEDIERGLKMAGFGLYEKILSRREAISRAIQIAQNGEAVVIVGKGSETVIHRPGGILEPWDDALEARHALQKFATLRQRENLE